MTKIEKAEFTCLRDGLTIRGTQYVPEHEGKIPAVIASHGFMGDRRNNAMYADFYTSKGYALFIYDFNGGGIRTKSDGRNEDMSVLTEIEDLKAVFNYVSALAFVDENDITLHGNSQGGFVSAYAAVELQEKVKRLILNYPAFSIPDDCNKGQNMDLKYDPENVPDVMKVGKIMTIGKRYVTDAQKQKPFDVMEGYQGPVLIIHGTKDKIVDVSYSKRAWLAYTSGKDMGTEFTYACEDDTCLPDVESPKFNKQLRLISGAGHGFHGEYFRTSVKAIELFLDGYTEVLTVDVNLTDRIIERNGIHTNLTLPFDGKAVGPYFKGTIQPGAKDEQDRVVTYAASKKAEYDIKGTDYTGKECTVHIINQGKGKEWNPTVSTDSEALSFLNNNTDLKAVLDPRQKGPMVRIYAKV